MADATPVQNPAPTPAAPAPTTIQINPDTATDQTIQVNPDLPAYDPAQDQRAAFQKVNLNPTGPTIAADHPTVLRRLSKTVLDSLPNYSTRTSANPNYNQAVSEPQNIMSSEERQAHPAVAGALQAVGEIATPGTILGTAATAGAAEVIPATAIIPKLVSALFAGQIAASIYKQYPELKAVADQAFAAKTPEDRAAATQEASRIFTHMGVDTAVGLLAAHHGVSAASDILQGTTASGIPDEASTFKAPAGAAPTTLHPDFEMTRGVVQSLRGLGYSEQQITQFDTPQIEQILQSNIKASSPNAPKVRFQGAQEPAPAVEPKAPLTTTESTAGPVSKLGAHLAETGKNFVDEAKAGLQRAAEATAPEGSLEAGFAKLGGKKVRGATPKPVPAPNLTLKPSHPSARRMLATHLRVSKINGLITLRGTKIRIPDIANSYYETIQESKSGVFAHDTAIVRCLHLSD